MGGSLWTLDLHGDRIASASKYPFDPSERKLATRLVEETPEGWLLTYGVEPSYDRRKCIANIILGQGAVRVQTLVQGVRIQPSSGLSPTSVHPFDLDVSNKKSVATAFLRPGDRIIFSEEKIAVDIVPPTPESQSLIKSSVEVKSSGAVPAHNQRSIHAEVNGLSDETDDDLDTPLQQPSVSQVTAAPFSTAQTNQYCVHETPRAMQETRPPTESPSLNAVKDEDFTRSSTAPQDEPAVLDALRNAGDHVSFTTFPAEDSSEGLLHVAEKPEVAEETPKKADTLVTKKQPAKRTSSGRGRRHKAVTADGPESPPVQKADEVEVTESKGTTAKRAALNDGSDEIPADEGVEPPALKQKSQEAEANKSKPSPLAAAGRGRGRGRKRLPEVIDETPAAKGDTSKRRRTTKENPETPTSNHEDTIEPPVSSVGGSQKLRKSQATPQSTAGDATTHNRNQLRIVFSSGSTMEDKTPIMRFLKSQRVTVTQDVAVKSGKADTETICCVGKGELQTTAKVLMALALNCKVVSDNWIEESFHAQELLEPGRFIVKELVATTDVNRSVVFQGKNVVFTQAARKYYGPAFGNVASILKAAGAENVSTRAARDIDVDSDDIIVIVSERNDKDAPDLREEGLDVYSKDLISASILQGELLTEESSFRPYAACGYGKKKKGEKRG